MEQSKTNKRFKVAFSFPGEYRAQVEIIVKGLIKANPDEFSEECILYDLFHRAEFARPNLDVYLQQMYLDSQLIVIFLCKEYSEKIWCSSVEWRAIRSLLNSGNEDERIMFVKCGEGEVTGVFGNVDGYIDLQEVGEQVVVDAIFQRCLIDKKHQKEKVKKISCETNKEYAKSFRAPLFLHREEETTKVTLENLFVMQKYKDLEYDEDEQKFVAVGGKSAKAKDDLQEFLVKFLNDNKNRCLFISGGAGVGKTSLVAWMNHHYEWEDDIGEKLFGKSSRPLITVRLRDLSKEQLTQARVIRCIYFNVL